MTVCGASDSLGVVQSFFAANTLRRVEREQLLQQVQRHRVSTREHSVPVDARLDWE